MSVVRLAAIGFDNRAKYIGVTNYYGNGRGSCRATNKLKRTKVLGKLMQVIITVHDQYKSNFVFRNNNIRTIIHLA